MTGNIFALPVLYFLLNFLAPLGDWLCNLFARGFLFGFTADYSGTVDFLCPMVYLTQRLYVNSEYETVRDSALEYQNRLTSVTLENAWLIAAYAAAGLVFLALAYLLYRRRESERAGDVVAVRVFRPVFRFGVAALSALLGGRLLYALLWESFQVGDLHPCAPGHLPHRGGPHRLLCRLHAPGEVPPGLPGQRRGSVVSRGRLRCLLRRDAL